MNQIYRFYIARFLGYFEFITPVFVLFLLANNLSMTQVLILQSLFTVTIFLMEVPSGVIADLFGLKKTLALSQILYILGFLVYGISFNFWGFLVGEILIGSAIAMMSGADSAWIYDTLKEQKQESKFKVYMGRSNAITIGAVGFSALFGGYISDLLLGTTIFGYQIPEYRALYFFGASSFLISFFLYISLKEPRLYKKVEDKKFFKHLAEGFGYVNKHKKLIKYIVYIAITQAMNFMMFYLIQPYYSEGGFNSTMMGIAIGAYMLMNAAGFLSTNKISKHFNIDKILVWILMGSIGVWISLYFSNVYIGMFIVIIFSFFSSIKELLIDHEVNLKTPSSHRATVLSVKNMGVNLVYAITAPFLGLITDVYDIRTSLLSVGIGLFLFLVFYLIVFRKD